MEKDKKEDDERTVVGVVSKELKKEFKELSFERKAITSIMDNLIDREVDLMKKHHEIWQKVRKEIPKVKELGMLTFSFDGETGEIYYNHDVNTYKEKYEQLWKLLHQ